MKNLNLVIEYARNATINPMNNLINLKFYILMSN